MGLCRLYYGTTPGTGCCVMCFLPPQCLEKQHPTLKCERLYATLVCVRVNIDIQLIHFPSLLYGYHRGTPCLTKLKHIALVLFFCSGLKKHGQRQSESLICTFFPSFSSSFPFHLTLLLSLTADILLSLAVAHC